MDIRVLRVLFEALGVNKLINPPIYACLDGELEVETSILSAGADTGDVLAIWGPRPEDYTTQGVAIHIHKGKEA